MVAPQVKILVPRKIFFDSARMTRVLETRMDMAAAGIKEDFLVTVLTWIQQPEFVIYKRTGVRIIATSDTIYRFLNRGTSVRRAAMTRGFRSKTVVGRIKSRVGRGRRSYISKKLALPGIQPRQFSETIANKWRKLFRVQFQRALEVELNRG